MRNILEQHGIEYIIQDGEYVAIEVSTKDDKIMCEWVNLSEVNVWHWLGY